MAATDRLHRLIALLMHGSSRALGLLGALFAANGAKAVTLPEDRADAMYHRYDGAGVRADGPAFLVRKSLLDKVSLSAMYYVDAVSSASIDVITTASPYSERRVEKSVGLDYVVRDGAISVSTSTSNEPDYVAKAVSVDVSQEVYGGMTTVALGYTRGWDDVGQKYNGFFDQAYHWRYRFGLTQVLTPLWIASVNLEKLSDDGYLGSPYRVARVFGAAVPENVPRTRTGQAIQLRAVGDIGVGSVRGSYRLYKDTWDIKANTAEAGFARHFDERWLGDTYLRWQSQKKALFYFDNATTETRYVSRNRQHSTYTAFGLGAKVSYDWLRQPASYNVKLHGAIERTRFNFRDYTDIRTGEPFSYDATVIQVYVSATF